MNCARQTAPACGRMQTDGHLQPPHAARSTLSICPSHASVLGALPLRNATRPQNPAYNLINRPIVCKSAPVSEAVAGTTASQPAAGPDFTLQCEETGTAIHVFGVEHLAPQPHIGEWIIRQRPAGVVVETAMGPEHGSMAGNVICCGDQVADPTAAFCLRMYCQIGVTLQEFKDRDFTESPLWNQVRSSYNGEQLAYIGAFATGVPLVFGDRPKDITYRRLFGLTTIPQLDEGYSYAAVQNYRAFLGLAPPPYDPHSLPVTEQITMQEREAVMLKVVFQLCHNALPQQQLAAGRPGSLVLVAGSAHLPGLEYLWRTGRWRELVGSGGANHPLTASHLMAAPPLPAAPEADPHYGLRRGLLQAMLRLNVNKEVVADLEAVLGPVPERHSTSYTAVQEVYGAPRMQLASLPREMLQGLVEGLGCDFYEVLQPMRDIRPMAGGPGFSEDMVAYVRGLNFELE